MKSVAIPESVTTIGVGAFRACQSITALTIPQNITTIGDYTFCLCSSLESVFIPDGVRSIGYSAFSWCSNLKVISIPASVDIIYGHAFSDCESLKSVYSYSQTPPSVSTRGDYYYDCPFDGTTYYNAALYVPEGYVEAYSSAEGWCQFQNIKTFDTDGFLDILDDSGANVVPISYYNLKGERFDYPQSGMNIIRYSNGQTKKVLITE